MLYISLNIQHLMNDPSQHVAHLADVFNALVFFSSTQIGVAVFVFARLTSPSDIAVDGWALMLLSPENLSYASTCQTIGLNTGYFTSYTVFLALNSESIAVQWGVARLTLAVSQVLMLCDVCHDVQRFILIFKREVSREPHRSSRRITDNPSGSRGKILSATRAYRLVKSTARSGPSVKCRVRVAPFPCILLNSQTDIRPLMILFVFGKIGCAANDAATSLKFVEKGLRTDDLAVAVLINFPFQIIGGWFVGARWSRGDYPLWPWLLAFWPRIGFALIAMLIVYCFPTLPMSGGFFVFLVIHIVLTRCTSTIQFVSSLAFFMCVSDPVIGGTCMTLLNTFSNVGTMWPKWFVLKSVDMFTVATCQITDDTNYVGCVPPSCPCPPVVRALALISRDGMVGKKLCADMQGVCLVNTDGYYPVTIFCMVVGVLMLVLYTIPTSKRLQALPVSSWRVKL
uniref:MFS general substrate transporter n=1 Tax=Mycena chlorophos TaxID=658473 RepID=A0ABQ0L556_MYCCL|nr:predicted protein [Mycena chlorophos]